MSAAPDFTIFGANGFLAGRILPLLEARGARVLRVTRDTWPAPGADLGHVIFTIGMTASFRTRPFETVETQVVSLHRALRDYTFASFLYLSSTRVYRGAGSTNEDADLIVRPTDPDDIYNLAKLSAESLCLTLPNPAVRVVRMSNVYGPTDRSDLFLTAVLREAIATGKVLLRTAPSSAKDYIHADDAAKALVAIATSGKSRLYNLAAGQNVTHEEIARALGAVGVGVDFAPGSPVVTFPPIDTTRLMAEFGAQFRGLEAALPDVYRAMKDRSQV